MASEKEDCAADKCGAAVHVVRQKVGYLQHRQCRYIYQPVAAAAKRSKRGGKEGGKRYADGPAMPNNRNACHTKTKTTASCSLTSIFLLRLSKSEDGPKHKNRSSIHTVVYASTIFFTGTYHIPGAKRGTPRYPRYKPTALDIPTRTTASACSLDYGPSLRRSPKSPSRPRHGITRNGALRNDRRREHGRREHGNERRSTARGGKHSPWPSFVKIVPIFLTSVLLLRQKTFTDFPSNFPRKTWVDTLIFFVITP